MIKDIFCGNNSLLVANSAASGDKYPTPPHHLTLARTPFGNSLDNSDILFLYNCTKKLPEYGTYPISCATNDTHYSFAVVHDYLLSYPIESCQSSDYAPVNSENSGSGSKVYEMNYAEILKIGFHLNWTAHNCSSCEASGGRCGYDKNEFMCFRKDKPHHKTCDDGNKRDITLKAAIAAGATVVGMLIMGVIAFLYIRRNKKKYAPSFSSYVSRSIYSGSSSGVDIEKGDDFHGLKVFTYTELEEATHNFDSAKELGDGGFGTVYYGKLRDGRAVAVKRLYENNCRRVEQFMNEIEILAHLRHQNLVSLYGCTSRHSRELLLVYEYIPNGTVADHLHGERAKPGALPWHTRLKIAIETANALKYLHASDVIHRDVKTNNILLDNNFCVKVADFGLSRLFPNHVTHVSTAPQGTPGYVDPEYHQCYQLTDKSDVFSFGVVMIELISSMPAVDITRHRHEINLSNMAMNKIQNRALHELVDQSLGFDSDYKVRKMINAVAELAFQCLQSEKDMRPSMADVLETLKGIQNDGYNKEKAEVMDIPADDVGLLKSGSLSMSPDSVTFNWTSEKTTPNASSEVFSSRFISFSNA